MDADKNRRPPLRPETVWEASDDFGGNLVGYRMECQKPKPTGPSCVQSGTDGEH
jgi:hypothetical protein